MPRWLARRYEQIEFVRGQLDLAIADARVAARGIDREAAGDDRRRVPRGGTGRTPPQQCADARDELPDAERLGQVVVGSALETEHLVRLFAARGQHQDRHVAVQRLAPHRPADGDAVELGQHHVQDEQIERIGLREPQPFRPGPGRDGRQPLEPEVQHDEIADVPIVLDDEDARTPAVGLPFLHCHPTSLAPTPRWKPDATVFSQEAGPRW